MIQFARSGVMAGLLLSAACVSPSASAQSASQEAFWAQLQALCGQAFAGRLLAEPDKELAGQPLVIHFRSCDEQLIRVPLIIGDNRSRTWLLSRDEQGLMLRHDHRDERGVPEQATDYGGRTPSHGTDRLQIFPADDRTLSRLSNNTPNVWLLEVDPGVRLTYYVRRLATERHFHFEFDLSTPVEAPPAPWGWSALTEHTE